MSFHFSYEFSTRKYLISENLVSGEAFCASFRTQDSGIVSINRSTSQMVRRHVRQTPSRLFELYLGPSDVELANMEKND
jgi:hypothetical protein